MAEEKCISRAEARRILVEDYGWAPQADNAWGRLVGVYIEAGTAGDEVGCMFRSDWGDDHGYKRSGCGTADPTLLGLLILASDPCELEAEMPRVAPKRRSMREELGWLLHNCVAHPVFGVLQFLGIYRLGRWIHDGLTPTS